jgi:O-antigen/teichoic acid export membrane protein
VQSMNRRIGVGVLWNLLNLVMGRGSSVIFTLFLARFLAPEAFGLIALTTVTFELATVLSQSGLGQALIRSKSISQLDLSTVFFTNLVLSVLAYGSLFLAAPHFAGFYDQPELTALVRAAGLVVFLNAFKVVQVATFRRAMNFRAEMQANSIGVLVSGLCAVTMAYLGAGVWSLVAQMLTSAAVSSGVLWAIGNWRPSLRWSRASFNHLFGFGSHLALEGMLDVVYQNSYVLVIGGLYSAEITGLYFFAKRLSNLVSQQLTGAVQQATFPALATMQDDRVKLRRTYRRIIQLMMFMIAPVLLLLAGLAKPLFELLFAEKWSDAVPYLQLLTLVGVLYPMHALNVNILNVVGRSDLMLRVGLVKKAVSIALLIVTITYGIKAIIIGQIIGSLVALTANTYFSQRLIGYGLMDQLLDALKPLLAASLGALAAYLSTPLIDASVIVQLCVAAPVGLVSYITISLLLKAEGCMFALKRIGDLPKFNLGTGSQ